VRNVVINSYGVVGRKCIVQYPFITSEKSSVSTNQLSNILDDDYLHVVYSGALGEKQKPFELARFLKALCESRKNVKCHIFSRGPQFDELRQWSLFKETDCLSFHDLVPENQLSELYERSTVHVIPQAEGTGSGAFPSKLPNLLSHGVPVFAICDNSSELADIIGKTKYSKSVASWDIQNLVQEMNEFLDDVAGVSHEDILNQYQGTLLKMFSVENLLEHIVQNRHSKIIGYNIPLKTFNNKKMVF